MKTGILYPMLAVAGALLLVNLFMIFVVDPYVAKQAKKNCECPKPAEALTAA